MKSASAWPRRLAILVALLALPLIYRGGQVTTTGSGLAVPDWPQTFHQNMNTYDWTHAPRPVQIEHTHRLLGEVVGFAAIALAFVTAIFEKRPRVRWLGFVALGLVCIQGVLGGMRVVLVEHGLAPVHGSFAQACFAFFAILIALTSRGWHEALTIAPPRRLAIATAVLAYVQVLLGAYYRHFKIEGSRLEPHAINAFLVVALVVALAWKVQKDRVLARWALGVVVATGAQIGLGIATWLLTPANISPEIKIALVSTHLVCAALVVGGTAGLATLCYRERAAKPVSSERPIEVAVGAGA